jgi:hypothetical protein
VPISITATVGSASANSFVTLAEADAYMDGRLNGSAWESATEDNQNRALVEATRELSARTWKGRRVDDTQALAWPRQWAGDPDSPLQGYFDTDVVPQRVKDACCELAFQFIKAGTTDVAAQDSTIGVTREKVGEIETEYAEPHARTQGLRRYPRVWALIAPLLEQRMGQVNLVRG